MSNNISAVYSSPVHARRRYESLVARGTDSALVWEAMRDRLLCAAIMAPPLHGVADRLRDRAADCAARAARAR